MDIKIDIQAPELVKAIYALVDALSAQKPQSLEVSNVSSTAVSKQEQESAPSQETTTTVSEQQMDVVELRKLVTDAIKDGKFTNAEVRTALSGFDVAKLTDLKSDQYQAFLGVLFGK
jgi:hypothetical protein